MVPPRSTAVEWPDRFAAWLRNPRLATQFWLGKYCVGVAWLGLTLAILLPPHGSGIALCWIQSATAIPCPGCGMTRSLSCAVRGMVAESWQYHPFGLFVLALFLFTAAQSLFPGLVRERIAQFMRARALFFNGLHFTFVVTFVGFGLVRALLYCAQHLHP